MDLEERIARLIDPEAWETVDYLRELGVSVGPRHRTSAVTLAAARRVIDGLGLTGQYLRPYDQRLISRVSFPASLLQYPEEWFESNTPDGCTGTPRTQEDT